MAEITPELRAKLNASSEVVIRAVTPYMDFNATTFAVNWFNTKISWMYTLYNYLAAPAVLKLGAKAVFKGKVEKQLYGDGRYARKYFLLVKYGTYHQFKQLMENAYFRAVSIFRILAVKEFTFGFSRKQAMNYAKKQDSDTYALQLLPASGENDYQYREELENLVRGSSIHLFYAGKLAARLGGQRSGKELREVPALFQYVVLLRGEKQEDLNTFLHSHDYQRYMTKYQANFVGTLKRIF